MNSIRNRINRKYREHLRADPSGLSLFRYVCKWVVHKFRRKVNNQYKNKKKVIIENSKNRLLVGVKVTGGLGDYVVLSRVVRDLNTLSGGIIDFYIFCSAPGSGQWLWKNDSSVKKIYDEIFFDAYTSSFDCTLFLNQFALYDEENINIEKIMTLAPAFGNALANCRKNRKEWNIFIDNHPVLDGAFAHTAVAQGFNRFNFIYYLFGMPPGDIKQDFYLEDDVASQLSEKYDKWITINTGFDINFIISERIATKCYSGENWKKAVKFIKAEHPEIAIIQIGGKNIISVEGVDENLSGKTSLAQSIGVLKRSLLHVDIEGGLVHIASSLNIKCVVLFGPTSRDYFGYANNINIKSDYCGDCWWTTERWMEACPRKHNSPRCLDMLKPKEVANAVTKGLHLTEVM
ncbi:MAG: hypothetical protein KAS17_02775 [Victivallaceae bacterium]|nr:hypothetical protein [Victivallaceae bacterium]